MFSHFIPKWYDKLRGFKYVEFKARTMNKLDLGKKNIVANGYTRYIALPIIWIRANKLLPGDRVDITLTEEDELTIRPAKARGSA